MQAIVSDIHANLEALEAVLEDMRKHNIKEVICLGDVIGYGPNPLECLDHAMDFKLTLRGNHEEALMVEMEGSGFNAKAQGSLEWTREQLSMFNDDRDDNAARWDFLGELPETYQEEDSFYVHGTPRNPICEYLKPRDIHNRSKMETHFDHINHVCFVGHTHISGVWTQEMTFETAKKLGYKYTIPDGKIFVNPGSIGQSRDGDRRASYVIRHNNKLAWRRVSYPVEKTAEKIRSIPELDPFLGERLLHGK